MGALTRANWRSADRANPWRARSLARLLGYVHISARLLRPAPDGAVFDAGEWKGAVGELAATLVFLDAPFAGSEFRVGGDDARPTLSVSDGQNDYVFVRTSTH